MITDYNKPLWPLLEPELQRVLQNAGTIERFDHKQLIHSRGTQTKGLSIVMSGRVRFGVFAENGTYIQIGLLGSGHCFGEATLFAETPRPYDADAFGNTEVLSIIKPVFDRLICDHGQVATALLTTLTSRLYEALEFADDLRALSLEARVAKYLLRATVAGGFKDGVLPVRQVDITYALGLSRVSVGKALTTLAEKGYIALGYRQITIRDFDALVQLCPLAS